jgi:pimeloyl-ACP methyl ester carboxylesterase
MADFTFIKTNGITLRTVVKGKGPLVILVHGFPESWYSWRHQIDPIAEAGFKVCAVDVRGYGGSDKPPLVEDYAMEKIIGDVVGLVDALGGGEKAILIGHDWGAPIVWNSALIRPDKIRAVAGLSVPHLNVGPMSLIDLVNELFTKNGIFFYQVYFQKEGIAEAELEADIRNALRRLYYAGSGDAPEDTWSATKPVNAKMLDGLVDPEVFPAWMTPEDLDYFVGEFERSGLRGPINRYRNNDRDFVYLSQFKERKIEQPAFFIGGSRDMVLTMIPGLDLLAQMRVDVPNLYGSVVLEGCGHWIQQERPEEVTRLLLDWLQTSAIIG